jgi:hypothetical protein
MADIKEYWRQVRIVEAELRAAHPSGCLFTTPTNDPQKNTCGGDAVHVTIEVAARGIVEGKSRVATEAEIATHKRHSEENLARSQAQDLRSQGLLKVVLGRPNPDGR